MLSLPECTNWFPGIQQVLMRILPNPVVEQWFKTRPRENPGNDIHRHEIFRVFISESGGPAGKTYSQHMGVSPKIGGLKPPKSSIFNRVFHYFYHPFWGTIIFGNTHIFQGRDCKHPLFSDQRCCIPKMWILTTSTWLKKTQEFKPQGRSGKKV